jgi:rSAM/selenodomain-associated transferase 1
MHSSATIIVFTREPVPGTAKTRLARHIGANNAATLTDAFTRDALAKAHATGVPLAIAASAPSSAAQSHYFRQLARCFHARLDDQGSGNLGTRMARVIAPCSAAGAILIGTDTPSLPLSALKRGLTLLRRAQVVLGPSLDGGYYLVGVRGPMPDIFSGIRWGGSRVLEETIRRLDHAGICYALAPAWYDIDRWSDLTLLATHLQLITRRRGANPCPATTRILRRLGLL